MSDWMPRLAPCRFSKATAKIKQIFLSAKIIFHLFFKPLFLKVAVNPESLCFSSQDPLVSLAKRVQR